MHTASSRRLPRSLPWLAALVLLLCSAAAAFAQQADENDPPGRVANLTYRHGSVVFAPEGEEEWVELPQNRPLTSGDRLWSDNGARAEVHLGSATLHVDGQSHLGISALDEQAAQFILMQGTVNARVRELAPGENFEIGTPNIAFRATQPGDFRIDVDQDGRETRVVVLSGSATVFGEGGQALTIGAGQQATFAGRFLAQVHGTPFQHDEFAQWAGERNRAEDQSVAARYVPRGVVGYQQLDQHGTWSQDPTYGAVWYPQVAVADWAPYRYGRWSWVDPWGWTWIDDAPWGFAPFHYGRWAMLGSRWAWVPGRMVARPVYSPALVSFFGGGGGVSFSIGAGPGVGWYPLAPGEAWWPAYRTTPRYVNFANFNINLTRYPRHFHDHVHRRHGHAVTAVREDDFRSGRSVRTAWRPLQPSMIGQARIGVVPARPDVRDRRAHREAFGGSARLQVAPRTSVQPAMPSQFWGQGREGWERARQQRDTAQRFERIERREQREQQVVQPQPRFVQPAPQVQQQQPPQPRFVPGDRDRAVREQAQAQREQFRLQREAEHNARQQQREAWQQRQQQEQPRFQPQQPRFVQQPQQPLQPQVQQQQAAPIGRERGFDRGGERGERGGRGEGRGQRDDDGGRGGQRWQSGRG